MVQKWYILVNLIKFESATTGVEVFIGSKVQCLFCFKASTTEGRGGEMRKSAKFQMKAHRTFDPRNNSTPVQLIKQATTPIFHFLKSTNWGTGLAQPLPRKIIRRYGSFTDGRTDFLPKPIPPFWLRVESVCWPYGSADGKNLGQKVYFYLHASNTQYTKQHKTRKYELLMHRRYFGMRGH